MSSCATWLGIDLTSSMREGRATFLPFRLVLIVKLKVKV